MFKEILKEEARLDYGRIYAGRCLNNVAKCISGNAWQDEIRCEKHLLAGKTFVAPDPGLMYMGV